MEKIQAVILQTVTEDLGPKRRHHHDQFHENDKHITTVSDTKKKIYVEWQNEQSSMFKRDKFRYLKNKAQSEQ